MCSFFSSQVLSEQAQVLYNTRNQADKKRKFEDFPANVVQHLKDLLENLAPMSDMYADDCLLFVVIFDRPGIGKLKDMVRLDDVEADDQREGLHGQKKLVAQKTIPRHTILGFYSGKVWEETEFLEHQCHDILCLMKLFVTIICFDYRYIFVMQIVMKGIHLVLISS